MNMNMRTLHPGLATAMLVTLTTIPLAAQVVTLRGTVAGTGNTPRPVPIAGATIEIGKTKQRATSDSIGGFVFPRVPKGTYTITASAPGYAPVSMQTELKDDQVIYITLASTQAKAYDVSGTIFERGNQVAQRPLAGATITLMPGNLSTTADKSGRFSIARVPSAAYMMTVSAPGHKSTNARFTLSANQVLNITLAIDESAARAPLTFTGTVVRLAGSVRIPVEGATVMVSPGGYAAASDSTGRFSIPGLPPDTYGVVVRAAGQRLLERWVKLPDESDVTLVLDSE